MHKIFEIQYLREFIAELRGDLHFLFLLLQNDWIEHLAPRKVYFMAVPKGSMYVWGDENIYCMHLPTSDRNPVAANVQPMMV